MQVFIWEALRPLEGQGKTGAGEGSRGRRVSEPVSTVAACGCRELCPPGSLGSRVELAPEQARPRAPLRSLPLGLVKGRSWGASPLHPRSSTPEEELCSGAGLCGLISGDGAQAVSVRGGRGVCPLQGAEDTGDTLHPAV